MLKHKASLGLFIGAVLAYLLFGLVLPEVSYSPGSQVEVGWDGIQVVKSMLETGAPAIAAFLAALGVLFFLKEQK